MIHLDTSALVAALSGERSALPELRRLASQPEPLALSCLVLYEWLRGPRREPELADQRALFPAASILPFGPEDAAHAARIYRQVRRPRPRATDLAIAAVAIRHNAALWSLNPGDFGDIPGLKLVRGG